MSVSKEAMLASIDGMMAQLHAFRMMVADEWVPPEPDEGEECRHLNRMATYAGEVCRDCGQDLAAASDVGVADDNSEDARG